jgi:hypothetical protein
VAAVCSAALLALSPAAEAQRQSIMDPAGDAIGGLDITSVQFINHDHAIITNLTFTRDRPDDVIVAIKDRHHRLISLIVSPHHRKGPDEPFLLGHPDCPGLSSHWNRSAAKLTLRLPANCVLNGNYGAIKAWALIESLRNGPDVDWAPEKPKGHIAFSDWIPRG